MPFREHFIPVRTKTANEVRAYMAQHTPAFYQLIDVRQPKEYAQAHIEGATLIPLKELPRRANELDPDKPTIVYCRSGRRSNSAAELLITNGFSEVYNLPGGMIAWRDQESDDGPQASISILPRGAGLKELAAFAWIMEEGTARFYATVGDWMAAPDVVALFTGLIAAEEKHKETIARLCAEKAGGDMGEAVRALRGGDEQWLEGGMKLADALEWAEGRSIMSLLTFALALETNSHDLYLKIGGRLEDKGCRSLFEALAKDEWEHVERISDLLDKYL